jgi:hypothetical protein
MCTIPVGPEKRGRKFEQAVVGATVAAAKDVEMTLGRKESRITVVREHAEVKDEKDTKWVSVHCDVC